MGRKIGFKIEKKEGQAQSLPKFKELLTVLSKQFWPKFEMQTSIGDGLSWLCHEKAQKGENFEFEFEV